MCWSNCRGRAGIGDGENGAQLRGVTAAWNFRILFSLYAIVSFYQKKAIVPRLMIIFYGISFLIGAIDTLLVYQIPAAKELDSGDSVMDIVRSFITCLIWIPYFLKSERVKNTFIR
ncbi:DUF2569 domain-containing protein [Paenibacillus agaridevorans]|uniref:DUF2569 domain-containing protein n=1 Tax=Paenibacillus agaridevorans TaxID=171404 RepID=UPI001BE48A0A